MNYTVIYRFEEIRFHEPRHWQVFHRGVGLDHWPTVGKWRTQGKTFISTPDEVRRAIEAGRFAISAEAKEGVCRSCGMAGYWLTTDKGNPQLTECNGLPHFPRCPKGERGNG